MIKILTFFEDHLLQTTKARYIVYLPSNFAFLLASLLQFFSRYVLVFYLEDLGGYVSGKMLRAAGAVIVLDKRR